MSLLDLVLVLVASAAGAAGWTMGLLNRLFSWLGLLVGLILVSLGLPILLDQLSHLDEQWLLLIVILLVVAAAMAGQALGMLAGDHLRVRLDPRFNRADAAGGALMGVTGVLLVVWLVTPAVQTVPGWSADQVAGSAVVRLIENATPEPPDTFRTLRRLVGSEQFPEVFSANAPGIEVASPPTTVPIPGVVVAEVSASVVRIRAVACSQRQDGTGFFIDDGLVLTNAHVVAGSVNIKVFTEDGSQYEATTMAYDPDRDLAVLRIDAESFASLGLADAENGDLGAVLGHPLGGDLRVAPAAIAERVRARGRDLYDDHDTSRQVFFLAASLEPGDSGGPLIDLLGDVVGVIFAIAPDDHDVAFALTSLEIREFLESQDLTAATYTGSCL